MTAVVACSFESAGPAGTTLSNANTGGTMSLGTGATAVSTATGVGFGALAGSYSVSTSAASSRTDFAITGGTLITAYSIKFHVPVAFATTKRITALVNTSAASVLTINLNGSTGQVQVQDSASTTASSASAVWTTGVTYRLELLTVVGTTTTGFYNLNLYANDGKTPLTPAVTRSNANMGTAALATIQAGIINNGTTVAANVIIDSIRYEVGGTVELGPESAVVTAVAGAGLAGVGSALKAAPVGGLAGVGLVGRAVGAKAGVVVARAAVGAAARGTVVKVGTVAGRAALGGVQVATGKKSATVTGRALAGLSANRIIRRERGTLTGGRRKPATATAGHRITRED